MTRKAREIETILLTMFSALPLYLTYAVGRVPIAVFHLLMAAIAFRVWRGKGQELIPLRVMRWLGLASIPFYPIDWRVLSGSAIAASTHLVLFIAVYQAIESAHRNNQAQRLLTLSLIFVASIATSTHVSIVVFVIAFAFLLFRQLLYLSHLDTVKAAGQPYGEAPSSRSAAFYLAGSVVIGAVLFPLLPRVRSPFVQGITGSLSGAATGLSETINFAERRITPADTAVVARVWMDHQAAPFFTPIRLRGRIYDRYWGEEWRQSHRGVREVRASGGEHVIARPEGIPRRAIVQQRPQRGKLFLPVGTYSVTGVSRLFEGPPAETFFTPDDGMLNLSVEMATQAEPLQLTRIAPLNYPITPEVTALARSIVGNETDPRRIASAIESHLSVNYSYLANPAALGSMTVDDFLLRVKRGHCEYFAAGMVVLLSAVDVPARIAGGFYGGRLNPLTGYYTLRREDAHAWTEVWDGTRWMTFDSTPPSLRPGMQSTGRLRAMFAALADSINFIWDRYILTFGLADQVQLAADGLAWARETMTALRARIAADTREVLGPGFALLFALVVALGFLTIWLARRRVALFDLITTRLVALGVKVDRSMTIEEAIARLREIDSAAAERMASIARLYEEETFSGRRDRERARVIRRELATLR